MLADTALRTNSADACPCRPVLTGAGLQIEDEMAKTQKNKATSYHLGASLASTCHGAPADPLLTCSFPLSRASLPLRCTGQLRAKLAKLKRELIMPSGGGGGAGIGFDVARTGIASVGFVGFPSVGKSTL